MCVSTYRLYCKGLVSEEVVKDESRQIGGFGVAICDAEDNRLFEMKKVLGDEESSHQQVAELASLIHALNWALELDLGRVTFFCDDSNILEYVTGKAEPNESNVATLVKEVSLLQSRFLFCEALPVSRDITFVLQLAKDAITSQIRWREGNVYMETCPLCYEHVPSDEKLEVPGCFHRFCVDCIKKQAEVALELVKPVNCPSLGCNSELQREDCEGLLEPKQLDLMTKYKKASMIKGSERVYCPTCDNVMAKPNLIEYTKSFFVDAELSGARKCTECGYCFCGKCKAGWHYGMTCDEFVKSESIETSSEDEECYEALAKSLGWKRCGNCKLMIAHDGGCNRIICSCKFEFCFVCGAEWNKEANCNCPTGLESDDQ
ncbi:Zinc finger RING-type [Arabidopsis suecica]|uniref:RBR-type E3 ubiquitin transferase n=1 Tax=Arabidopsis suecica TaxID=45249 RepID=A0A8T1Z7E1_ARASU|nr:Zinc finger RING-type [Arabidopsis suecica]